MKKNMSMMKTLNQTDLRRVQQTYTFGFQKKRLWHMRGRKYKNER